MENRNNNKDLFVDCRYYWLRGRCPCCGDELIAWTGTQRVRPEGTFEPKAIAEGVRICGRCVAQEHMENGVLEGILHALLP